MFDVDPARIEDLDAKTLVILLRKLLHAEALTAGLSLAAVSVPLQITVPDNGEDGRIDWEGGIATTEFLPGRINRFQSKAGKLDRSGWKKEFWTKSSQRPGGQNASFRARSRMPWPSVAATLGLRPSL
ncbi:hypothetical protein [uncultured Devosia sp.]|uniref:hypothetical protein n=1 Tax=uncultured Devosia sp. TaxID=211434 RepID=UPI0035C969E0